MCDEFLNNFALALLASLFLKTITMQIKVICMNWGREFLFSGRTFLWGSCFYLQVRLQKHCHPPAPFLLTPILLHREGFSLFSLKMDIVSILENKIFLTDLI